MKKNSLSVPKNINAALEAVAKGIGVAATELWTIFVRQYIVRGIMCAFTGLVLVASSFFLWQFIQLFALIPVGISVVLFCGAIMYIGNPKYYALEDITNRLNELKNNLDGKKEDIKLSPSKKSGPGTYMYW